MKLFLKRYFIIVLLMLIVFSCSQDGGIPGLVDEPGIVYAGSNLLHTHTIPNIKFIFTQASLVDPVAAEFIDEVKYGVEVSEVFYNTTLGEDKILGSGLICIPQKPGSYPVLCFQNGTNVLHDKAPTQNYTDNLFLLLESIASMGFVVVIPDYPGFGTSSNKPHPYLVKEETLPALEDILRASREFVNKSLFDITLNNQLFLMGYSQGAWATLQLQSKIEQKGLESFELVASSCGGGPYNISEIFSQKLLLDEYPQPYFLAYLMNSYVEYDQFNGEIQLTDIFKEPYASEIPDLFDGKYSSGEINSALTTNITELITVEYLNGFEDDSKFLPVRNAQAENSVKIWQMSTPTRLYHGEEDEIVPFNISTELALAMSNDELEVIPFPGLGHTESVIPFGLQTIEWFISLK